MHFRGIFLLSLATSVLSSPLTSSSQQKRATPPANPPVTQIYEFAKGTWVENLAVRSNGQIVANLLSSPQVYQVDPTQQASPVLLHTFPGYLGLTGIAQLQTDIFYVVAGNFSTVTLKTTPGTFSVWKIDLTKFTSATSPLPPVTKVADFPNASFLNGMTPLTANGDILLIADAGLGAVWTLNVNTGATSKAITNALFNPVSTGFDIGINGLHVENSTLYFTNTDQDIFGQVPINTATGAATGSVTAVVKNVTATDDFELDSAGNAFLAGNNELRFLDLPDPSGAQPVLVSNNTLLAGSTSVAGNGGCKYVSTNGGVLQYLSRNFTTGGRVVKVELGSFS